jgi:hypothetical protein
MFLASPGYKIVKYLVEGVIDYPGLYTSGYCNSGLFLTQSGQEKMNQGLLWIDPFG